MRRVAPGVHANGLMATCEAYDIFQDVGLGIFLWTFKLTFISGNFKQSTQEFMAERVSKNRPTPRFLASIWGIHGSKTWVDGMGKRIRLNMIELDEWFTAQLSGVDVVDAAER